MSLEEAEARIKKLEAENKQLREIIDRIEDRIEKHAGQATRNFEHMDERVRKLGG